MIACITEELGVEVEIFETKDLECLKELNVPEVGKLFLNIHKPISLRFLKDFVNLNQLLIAGSLKDPDPIAQCSKIEKLSMQGVTLDSLDFITELPLKTLALSNVKTRVDKLIIPNIPTVEKLLLDGVHKIGDLDFLTDFVGINELALHWLKTKRLFNFSKLKKLEQLYLHRMLHLTSIKELNTSSSLRFLAITETPKLKMTELQVVGKIKSLEKLYISFITENPNSYKRYVQEIGQGHLLCD